MIWCVNKVKTDIFYDHCASYLNIWQSNRELNAFLSFFTTNEIINWKIIKWNHHQINFLYWSQHAAAAATWGYDDSTKNNFMMMRWEDPMEELIFAIKYALNWLQSYHRIGSWGRKEVYTLRDCYHNQFHSLTALCIFAMWQES